MPVHLPGAITWTAADDGALHTLELEVDGGGSHTIVWDATVPDADIDADITAVSTLMTAVVAATDPDLRAVGAAGYILTFSKRDGAGPDTRYTAVYGVYRQPKDPAAGDAVVVTLIGRNGVNILDGVSTTALITAAAAALLALI